MRPILVLVLFSFLAVQAKESLVAVGDLAARGIGTTDAEILGDRLRAELVSTGEVRVMERSQMDQILREQAFQRSGACEGGECAVEIGKLLAVDRMVVGSVGRIGEMYTIQLRVLDVGTGENVFSASRDHEGKIEALLSRVVPELAGHLASSLATDSGARAAMTRSVIPLDAPRKAGGGSGNAKSWLRWGCAFGAVGAGVVGVLSHREASDQNDKAARAVWQYNEAKSGFADYKRIHLTAIDKANSATDRAIASDVLAGLLLAGFTFTFAF